MNVEVTRRSVIEADKSSRKNMNVKRLFEKNTSQIQTKKLNVVRV